MLGGETTLKTFTYFKVLKQGWRDGSVVDSACLLCNEDQSLDPRTTSSGSQMSETQLLLGLGWGGGACTHMHIHSYT